MMNSFQVISFDMYGTLVNRLTNHSTDIFHILEKRFFSVYGYSLKDFAKKRIRSETELRVNKNAKINLRDIYNNIEGLSRNDKERCINLEMEIEYDLSYPNKSGIQLYKKACQKNVKIVIITDMYLPEFLLKSILEKCKITNIYKIYISGHIGKSKSNNGDLFKVVCQDLSISSSQIVHIGDNIKSDYWNAVVKGIKAHLLWNDLKINPILKFIQNTNSICNNYDEDLGYQFFGTLTLGYLSWIYKQCKDNKINALYFFSREGLFLKKIFDYLYGDEIQTTYIFVSRKSLSIPLLQFCHNYEEITKLVYTSRKISVDRFLFKLGLTGEKIINRLNKDNIRSTTKLGDIKNKALLFQAIQSEMSELSKSQFANIRSYFNKVIKDSKIGIVDIGWTGTMQNSFIEILKRCNIECDVTGFFIGQKRKVSFYINKGMKNYGYLFNHNNRYEQSLVASGEALLETVYFANHGTTVGYDNNGPVLESIDISDVTKNHLFDVQSGVEKFITQLGYINKKYNLISSYDAFFFLEKLFAHPSLKQVSHIGEWEFFDDKIVKLAPKTNIVPTSNFIKDFLEAGWKIAFLKRNLKVNLPYFKLYNLLREGYLLTHKWT